MEDNMKFKDKLQRFMYGRYGPDNLYNFLFGLYIFIIIHHKECSVNYQMHTKCTKRGV